MTNGEAVESTGGGQFDHNSIEHAADPACSYRALRESAGLTHSDRYGGFYVVSRYDDLVTAARDRQTFSSARDQGQPGGEGGGLLIPPNPTTRLSLIEMDPPEWRRVRTAVNPWLSPAAVEKSFLSTIRALTEAFIDGFIENGCADLVLDLANPIPSIITLDFIGFGHDDWEKFARPIHELAYIPKDKPEYEAVGKGLMWIMMRVRELIARRRREPAQDLVSYLVSHDAEGRPFTDDEIAELVMIVIFGGIDTTTALIANALNYLAGNPADRGRLIADPALMDSALEEFLRLFTPVQATARTVTKETSLAGTTLHRGDRVLLSWASANRDADQFDAPDEVRLDREPNRHCAFGLGLHRCVGSNLGRAQFKIIVSEVLRRLPDYQVVPDGAKRYQRVGEVNGWATLPVVFTPGQREGKSDEDVVITSPS
jgi:cytochrome P450